MIPTRETFGNIPHGSVILFYGLTVVTMAVFAGGVWRRVNRSNETGKITRGKGKNTRLGLRLLYELAEKVNIKARWPMDRQVEAIWAARWPTNAIDAIRYALRTARK